LAQGKELPEDERQIVVQVVPLDSCSRNIVKSKLVARDRTQVKILDSCKLVVANHSLLNLEKDSTKKISKAMKLFTVNDLLRLLSFEWGIPQDQIRLRLCLSYKQYVSNHYHSYNRLKSLFGKGKAPESKGQ
jgi:hypothetical protein